MAVFVLGNTETVSPIANDGTMVLPGGGGVVSFTSGILTLANGNQVPVGTSQISFVTLPDGRRVLLQNGYVLANDGTVTSGTTQSDGTIILLDGTVIYANGNYILPYGEGRGMAEITQALVANLPNGMFALSTGDVLTVSKIPAIGRLTPQGSIIFPNGMEVHPDGSVMIGSNRTIQTTVMDNYYLLPDGRIILKDGRIFTNLGREQFDAASAQTGGSGGTGLSSLADGEILLRFAW